MVLTNTNIHRNLIRQSLRICVIALVLLVFPAPVQALKNSTDQNNLLERSKPAGQEYPLEPGGIFDGNSGETALPDFKSFVENVKNGRKGLLRGVYVPGVMAVPVVQQPVGNPAFVSLNNDEITQFSMATEAGNVGLLAHNHLTGASFTSLVPGQEVRLVYGDGAVEYFVVDQILRYQALEPFNPSGMFRDLGSRATLSAEQLFHKVYRGKRHVTFQTCIDAYGNSSWGRLFITAQPASTPPIEQ